MESGSILSATTDGTVANNPFYEKTHVTRWGKGVVSSVILGVSTGTVLPPNGTTPYDILALEIGGASARAAN